MIIFLIIIKPDVSIEIESALAKNNEINMECLSIVNFIIDSAINRSSVLPNFIQDDLNVNIESILEFSEEIEAVITNNEEEIKENKHFNKIESEKLRDFLVSLKLKPLTFGRVAKFMKHVCDFYVGDSSESYVRHHILTQLWYYTDNSSLNTQQLERMKFYLEKYVKYLGFNFEISSNDLHSVEKPQYVMKVYTEMVEKAIKSSSENAFRDCLLLNVCYSLKVPLEHALDVGCYSFTSCGPMMRLIWGDQNSITKRKVNNEVYYQLMYFHFKSGCDLKKHQCKFLKVTSVNALRKRMRKGPMSKINNQILKHITAPINKFADSVYKMFYIKSIDEKISKSIKFKEHFERLYERQGFKRDE